MYLGLVWFLILPISWIGVPINIFTIVIILFIVVDTFGRITKINMEYLYTILVVLRIILDYKTVFTLNFFINFITIILVFLFFRFFILKLAFEMDVEKIKIKNLKEGMETAEGIKKIGKKYKKIKLLQISFYDFFSQKKENFIHSKTLTEEDIKKIKNLKQTGKISFDMILVHKPILFAIFLYFGFIITLIIRTDFIHALFI